MGSGFWRDYEHRSGNRNSIINCCTEAVPANINITPLLLEATSNMSSGGFVGGIDGTKRGWWSRTDGVVFGLLGGYTWTNISLTTTAVSTAPNKTASGSSWTSAHINGPSLGGYLSYFNGPFSNDLLIKNDFLSLNETQSQLLVSGRAPAIAHHDIAFVSPQFGSGSTEPKSADAFGRHHLQVLLVPLDVDRTDRRCSIRQFDLFFQRPGAWAG